MDKQNITVERVGDNKDVVKLSLGEEVNPSELIPALFSAIEECFQNQDYKIILDMRRIKFPPSSFIALLIEVTARARRNGGDVKLINVSHTARNNLVTFSPLTYLSVDSDESFALQDFSAVNPLPLKEIPFAEAKWGEAQEETEHRLRVKSTTDSLYKICDFVTDLAAEAGMGDNDIEKTKVAVYEACLNVIEHAYHSNPDYWTDVRVDYDPRKFTITIQDQGEGFEFDSTKPYNVHEAIHERRTGGFGLYIIQRSMDEVKYESDPIKGNTLILTKYLGKDNN